MKVNFAVSSVALGSVFLLSLLFPVGISGCAVRPAPTSEQPSAPARTTAKPLPAEKAGWEEKWSKTLRAAREEGTIRVYTSIKSEARISMAKAFKEKYDIELEYVTGTPPEIAKKVVSERRAGLYLADVFISGGALIIVLLKPNDVLDPIEPVLILPEVVDPKVWMGGQLPFFDRELTSMRFAGALSRFMLRNTDMVKADEITSYRDLLNPKWKGKMVLQDPGLGSSCLWWITMLSEHIWGPEETSSYFKELRKQDVPVLADVRLQIEWVARGKYPIGIGATTDTVYEFMNAGAPLALAKASEGGMISSGAGGVALANKAPHPNGAALLINWLLGKEGQTVVSKTLPRPSLRLDVTKEGFNPLLFPEPGERTYIEDEKFILATSKVLAAFKDVFTP